MYSMAPINFYHSRITYRVCICNSSHRDVFKVYIYSIYLKFICLVSAAGKRFSRTSRFVVSSKVWQNTIPTRDCDVLLTFPKQAEDQTLMWLLSRLRSRTPNLQVHVRHHSSTGVYGFYLTAEYEM